MISERQGKRKFWNQIAFYSLIKVDKLSDRPLNGQCGKRNRFLRPKWIKIELNEPKNDEITGAEWRWRG